MFALVLVPVVAHVAADADVVNIVEVEVVAVDAVAVRGDKAVAAVQIHLTQGHIHV